MTNDADFFASGSTTPPDIVERMIREGQLVTVAGSFSVGKSPLLQELAVCIVSGRPFCGRTVSPRPVIYFDLENAAYSIEQNIRNICDKLGLDPPSTPDQLELYIHHGASHPGSGSEKLIQLLKLQEAKACVDFVADALSRKPNAVVIIDPAEMFFKIDTIRKVPVLELYGQLRELLARYPMAAIVLTFNLRKADKAVKRPNLFKYPRPWMEEVCGSLDLINRSDVRIGMDFYEEDDELKVVNGVRRGESFEQMVLQSVGVEPKLSGYRVCSPVEVDALAAFTPKQRGYWDALPPSFEYNEVVDTLVPHSTLDRIIHIGRSNELLEKMGTVFVKTAGIKVRFVKLFPD